MHRLLICSPVLLGMVCLVSAFTQGAEMEGGSVSLHSALAAQGLFDVEVRVSAHTAALAYENLAFRSDVAAMGTALATLVQAFPRCQGWTLVPRRWGIPLLRFRVPATPNNEFGIQRIAAPPDVGVEGRPSPSRPHGARGISPHGKLDLVLHPQVKAIFGGAGDPLRLQVNLAPEVFTTLTRGTALSAQVILPLKNELDEGADRGGDRIRPGRVALSRLWRPGGRWLALADVGLFEKHRYGGSVEVLRRTRTGRWGIGGQVGCTGFLAVRNDGVWEYSDPTVWTALVHLQVRVASKDMALRVRMGRFLHRDWGVRLDGVRAFRWMRLGFFGVWTTGGTTGGVDLRVPLSGSRWSTPRALRIRAPAVFPWTYRYHLKHSGYILDERHRIEEVIGGLYPAHVANRLWELQAAYEACSPHGKYAVIGEQ